MIALEKNKMIWINMLKLFMTSLIGKSSTIKNDDLVQPKIDKTADTKTFIAQENQKSLSDYTVSVDGDYWKIFGGSE